MQARFSIMKTFMKHSTDKNFLKLEMNSTNDDFAIKLDKSLIKTAGHECVKDYLKSTVTPDLASLRDIVLSKRLPRRQFIQSNSYIDDNNKVTLKEYDETPQGMLQSFLDREL
ncbi:ANM_HP_G0014170.mRNA.1.CDS.1 [Saccharomyces cerevisiae]|nr:ANM_HP_G0014170.mRNA.1.CDS.1 [Saccharomyces cerevisiae]CAI7019558.1 ANM_HP_G0014170.mRNA.1.CDS.1 [Saccharomyces cerevisiae]